VARQPAPALDEVDAVIVELLRGDGRLSVNELAQRAHISRANAYRRVNRLRGEGVIEGFTIRTNARRLGYDVTAFIIVHADQGSWREVRAQLLDLPGLDYLAALAGRFDFLLRVRVPDVDTLRDMVLEYLQDASGVRSTETLFVLDEEEPA
jgi:DNA-binding Lrp family transcriptional regulator